MGKKAHLDEVFVDWDLARLLVLDPAKLVVLDAECPHPLLLNDLVTQKACNLLAAGAGVSGNERDPE
ncbi:hypothetical protein [Paracoccus sp. 22332]|uniref:hypothetical protein n=1 Tax=Paracoccus sp. 22332 TaxID=3453913 RepID=UPI003F8547AA